MMARPTKNKLIKLIPVLTNFIISLTSMLVTLVLLEIAVRIVTPFPEGSRYSTATGWHGKPDEERAFRTDNYRHTIKRNSRGMHDIERTQAKSSGAFRIMMLGDSFAEAQQVNSSETARYVLEDLLNQSQSAKQFEVISGAVGGWGTGQQLVYYRTEGRLYQPDLVLLMFYLGNDVTDNLPVHRQTIDGITSYAPYFPICNGQLDPDPWYYAPGLAPVRNECPSPYKLLTNRMSRLYQISRLYTQLGSFFSLQQSSNFRRALPWPHLYIPIDNQQFDELFPEENEVLNYGWQVTFGIIKQLGREVQADGAQLAVVLVDPADTIGAAVLSADEQQLRRQVIPFLGEAQFDAPERRFVAELSDQNIKVLNLQPFFIERTEALAESLYFPYDKHWNVAGNRVAAEAIYCWLNKNSMLP